VAAWPEVQESAFVSREEGWEELKGWLPDARKLRGFGPSDLPDSVKLKVRDPAQVALVSEKLKGMAGVVEVPGRARDFARSVVQFQHVVTWIGLVIIILVSVAGVSIIHNTIRLAIHSHWREIYIMQLVGATRSLIAAPFVVEGAIHGITGAALACCLLVPAHMYLRLIVARAAPLFLLLPDRHLIEFVVYLLLGGAFLGVTGSAISIRRCLARKPEWHG
jgi:cell division transport system permease protein